MQAQDVVRIQTLCEEWRRLDETMERATPELKGLREETRPYPASVGGASFMLPAAEARGLLTMSIERMRARKRHIETMLGSILEQMFNPSKQWQAFKQGSIDPANPLADKIAKIDPLN